MSGIEDVAARFATPLIQWIALLGLCAAYLQGGFNKATDFEGAIREMNEFGVPAAMPMVIAAIVTELGASFLILAGYYRWIGALALAGFTLMSTFIADRFWELSPPKRRAVANAFFEHVGLIGGFLLVAWYDLKWPS